MGLLPLLLKDCYVDSERIIARPVAVRLRHDGLPLLCHLPPHAAEFSRERACHHLLHNAEPVVVGRSCTQLCYRVWDCPFMVRPARFVDRVAGDRIDPVRKSRAFSRPRVQTEAG